MGKRRRALIVTPILVVFLIVLGLFLYPIVAHDVAAGNQYLSQCSTRWPPQLPGPNKSQTQSVIAMTANADTTAKICTEYYSPNCNQSVGLLVGNVYFQSNMSLVPNSLIEITAQPNPVSALPQCDGSPAPVAYAVFTLRIANSTKGFYMLDLAGFCPMMPLAVGYTQVSSGDFTNGLNHENDCANPPSATGFVGNYVSVKEIGVAYSDS